MFVRQYRRSRYYLEFFGESIVIGARMRDDICRNIKHVPELPLTYKYSGIKDKHIALGLSMLSQFILQYMQIVGQKNTFRRWSNLLSESHGQWQYNTKEFRVVRNRRLDVSNRILQGCVKSVLVISWLIFEDRKLGFL